VTLLDDLLLRVTALPDDQRAVVVTDAMAATKGMRWLPSPGQQTKAYFSDADQLGYGGEPGGGKTDLILGAAIERHRRSLVLRRQAKEVPFLIERVAEVLDYTPPRRGFNGQEKRWQLDDGKVLQFGGCQNAGDERGYKGEPKDLIALDEATEFLESQVDFLVLWLRSADPAQHCQLILPSNPPGSAEGEWYVRWFAPWLDRTHPLFGQIGDGVLLYVLPVRGSRPTQFEWRYGPWSEVRDGRTVKAISRTFIRSGTADNPFYADSDYAQRLGAAPDHLRQRFQMGDFMAGMVDHERQLIPTAWILAAQARWEPEGAKHAPMTALALDPAGGGDDAAALVTRHDGWFSEVEARKGPETADGSAMAGWIGRRRRNACRVAVDVGGGYGGAVCLRLKDNQVPHTGFQGSAASHKRSKLYGVKYANKRSEAYGDLADELNPDQEGGSVIALHPDPEVLGDLAAPRFEITARGLQVESKVAFGADGKVIGGIRKRLGRSTNKGDAIAMCLSEGNRAQRRIRNGNGFSSEEQGRELDGSRVARPAVVMGHMAARRNR
jgi:hypothetical protein